MLIGRKKDAELLNELYDRHTPELVAVYGRRKVGKTYLINQVFKDRVTFSHAGLSPIEQPPAGVLERTGVRERVLHPHTADQIRPRDLGSVHKGVLVVEKRRRRWPGDPGRPDHRSRRRCGGHMRSQVHRQGILCRQGLSSHPHEPQGPRHRECTQKVHRAQRSDNHIRPQEIRIRMGFRLGGDPRRPVRIKTTDDTAGTCP